MVRGTPALVALLLTVAVGSASAAEKQAYPISFHAFAFAAGTSAGTKVDKGALVLGSGLTAITYADPFGYAPRDYRAGTWTSPWQPAGFPFMELVSSWNADTPAGTWIQVEMRATAPDGQITK